MIKNANGITLATLLITVIILSIIVSVTYSVGLNNLETKNLSNLYTDLKTLKDSIGIYYDKHGKLPLKEAYSGTYEFLVMANPNDNKDEYYVIDVNKLENLTLTRKLTWAGNDVYIINTKTHMIYYPEGVYVNSDAYYRLPGEYSQLILFETIDINVYPESWTSGAVTIKVVWADESEEGVKEVSIDGGQTWKSYTGPFSVNSNCTVQARRIDENNVIVATASINILNIDKEGPSAPMITGGSNKYSTSTTISIIEDAVDEKSGIAYYEYYLTSNSNMPTSDTVPTGRV